MNAIRNKVKKHLRSYFSDKLQDFTHSFNLWFKRSKIAKNLFCCSCLSVSINVTKILTAVFVSYNVLFIIPHIRVCIWPWITYRIHLIYMHCRKSLSVCFVFVVHLHAKRLIDNVSWLELLFFLPKKYGQGPKKHIFDLRTL